MKTLVIVDFQRDFFTKRGSLYVEGAEKAEDAIVKHIFTDNEIGDVIFTVDWHTPKHCSFKDNGGTWPIHCIQYSEGAAISQRLINACIYNGVPFKVFRKGNVDDKEEYGAFDKIGLFTNYEEKYTVVNNMAGNSYLRFEYPDIEVCGLAGDYCVKETLAKLSESGKINNIYTFMDGIASIDGGKALDEFLNTNEKIKKA